LDFIYIFWKTLLKERIGEKFFGELEEFGLILGSTNSSKGIVFKGNKGLFIYLKGRKGILIKGLN